MVQDFDVERQISRSVQTQPDLAAGTTPTTSDGLFGFAGGDTSGFILQLAQIADEFPPWGREWRRRDSMLRAMPHAESLLGGTVYALGLRNAAFTWTLTGPEPVVAAEQDLLNQASFGAGWQPFVQQFSADLYGQDNGAFIELIRAGSEPTDAVLGIANLDASRCLRTGRPLEPVVYRDDEQRDHILKWHQVVVAAENPSPIKRMRGMQTCGVSRALRGAQFIRDIMNFRKEKMGGRDLRSIHLLSGVTQSELKDALTRLRSDMDTAGLTRKADPLIVTAVDPERQVSVDTVDLASIPDGFDLTDEMTWWVVTLALAFGVDYQDIAPLQQGNLGNSQQSVVLDRKSRGKGPAAFMRLVEHAFNYKGVMPSNVDFAFDEMDPIADKEVAEVREVDMRWVNAAVLNGTLSASQAQQFMLDKGYISDETFGLFDPPLPDATPNVTAIDVERRVAAFTNLPGASGDDREDAAERLQRVMRERLATVRGEVRGSLGVKADAPARTRKTIERDEDGRVKAVTEEVLS